ncbi:MAG: hypothetical protein CMH56_06285 [Myxococcales bacterium]|nr:hypothetical protein [Myxococcales bacterium]
MAQETLRNLLRVWLDFEMRLGKVPVLRRLDLGTFTRKDYMRLLMNLRQQVIEGSRWITRAASSFDRSHAQLRSIVIGHAKDEHKDYEILEKDYVALGGNKDDIVGGERNLGSEALHAFLYHRASLPNPIDMIGAMFIIEGLGEKMANSWADKIEEQAECGKEATRFLRYHGENDETHMQRFYEMLNMVAISEERSKRIVKTARVVGRLYAMQLEELDIL